MRTCFLFVYTLPMMMIVTYISTLADSFTLIAARHSTNSLRDCFNQVTNTADELCCNQILYRLQQLDFAPDESDTDTNASHHNDFIASVGIESSPTPEADNAHAETQSPPTILPDQPFKSRSYRIKSHSSSQRNGGQPP